MEFKPQKVSPQDCLLWAKEALELTVRHPLLNVSVIGLMIYLFASFIWLSGFIFACIPVLLGIACVIAEAADLGDSPLTTLKRKSPRVWVRLFMLGIYPYLLAILGYCLVSLLPIEPATQADPSGYSSTFSAGVVMLFALYAWLVAGPFIWFFVPLLAVAELPLGLAATQAGQAYQLNRFVILLALAFGVIAQLAFLLPVLVFPLTALISSMMYASYRHIWLGRGLNHPVAQKQLKFATATSA